jgi:hypothetical protein
MLKDLLGVLAFVVGFLVLWILLPVILLIPTDLVQHFHGGAVLKDGNRYWRCAMARPAEERWLGAVRKVWKSLNAADHDKARRILTRLEAELVDATVARREQA